MAFSSHAAYTLYVPGLPSHSPLVLEQMPEPRPQCQHLVQAACSVGFCCSRAHGAPTGPGGTVSAYTIRICTVVDTRAGSAERRRMRCSPTETRKTMEGRLSRATVDLRSSPQKACERHVRGTWSCDSAHLVWRLRGNGMSADSLSRSSATAHLEWRT